MARSHRDASRRLRRTLLAAALIGASSALVACGGDGPTVPSPPVTTSSSSGITTTTSTTITPTTTTAPVTTIIPNPPPDEPLTLRRGDRGVAVTALQHRLTELGYWNGSPTGEFGNDTFHAVVALQKVAHLPRDGVVGPATRSALGAGTRPTARTRGGYAIEIHLGEQVLLVVRDGAVEAVFDTSTGRVSGTTPRGSWQVTREIDGPHRSALGLLYRPKYFYEGVAIHGYTSVPAYPASHGCVRLTYSAMDHLWDADLLPIGTRIVVSD